MNKKVLAVFPQGLFLPLKSKPIKLIAQAVPS